MPLFEVNPQPWSMQQIYSEAYVLRLERRIAELEAALKFYAAGDPQNPADGFVARDVLKLPPPAKKPDAQPTEES